MDDVFTLNIGGFDDENLAPATNSSKSLNSPALKPTSSQADDMDVNAILANMENDIMDAAVDQCQNSDNSTVPALPATEIKTETETQTVEAATATTADAAESVKDAIPETTDEELLQQLKSAISDDTFKDSIAGLETAPVVADTVTNADEDQQNIKIDCNTEADASEPVTESVTCVTESAVETIPSAEDSDNTATTVDTSIADRCAALLQSVAMSPTPCSTDIASNSGQNSTIETTTSAIMSTDYELISDKVAKFALEAMNEDEPKYTEKEMDVLYQKAKLEAQEAFDTRKQELIVQMEMMESKMKQLHAEKQAMTDEMSKIQEIVKSFEEMTETVARKKNDEIYSILASKKATEKQNKEFEAKIAELETKATKAEEVRTNTNVEHEKEVKALKEAHKTEVANLLAKMQVEKEESAQVKSTLLETQRKLAASEKQCNQLEAANQKTQKSLQEANANCDKYKQIGAKTRNQAQAQLDKAKALVVATKKENANFKHTISSLEATYKTTVEQLESEKQARSKAEAENKSLKETVDKQTEDMKQLTLEAYRCTKAEQELEKQKKTNKELYEMCNELMKQVEGSKAS